MDDFLRVRRFEGALAFAGEFEARCGLQRIMQRPIMAALRALQRWDDAIAMSSKLITLEPDNSVFWQWRAEVYERDQPLLALADYRQAIASDPVHSDAYGVRREIVAAALRADRPCEAEHAARYYTHNTSRDYPRIDGCQLEHGRGRARVVDGTKMQARIGSVSVTLEVDTRAGLTAISSTLARRTGLSFVSGERVTARLGNRIISGQLARIDRLQFGGLSASAVDVLVSDELSARNGGFVGLNFLWRFKVAYYDGVMSLTPPQSEPKPR